MGQLRAASLGGGASGVAAVASGARARACLFSAQPSPAPGEARADGTDPAALRSPATGPPVRRMDPLRPKSSKPRPVVGA